MDKKSRVARPFAAETVADTVAAPEYLSPPSRRPLCEPQEARLTAVAVERDALARYVPPLLNRAVA